MPYDKESLQPFEAFLTGSRVYGKPRPDSDVDLVVYLPNSVTRHLFRFSDELGSDWGDGWSVKFGMLNLIVPSDADHLRVWVEGTEALLMRYLESGTPVTRDEAVKEFTRLRNEELPKWRMERKKLDE